MRTPLPLPKKGAEPPPQFSAHFYCGQTAGWIKMALGMELGLGPGDFVLDGDPAAPSPKRGLESPQFVPFLLVGLYSSSSSTALCILFLEKSLIILSLFQYKYWIEYLLCERRQWERTGVESLNFLILCFRSILSGMILRWRSAKTANSVV